MRFELSEAIPGTPTVRISKLFFWAAVSAALVAGVALGFLRLQYPGFEPWIMRGMSLLSVLAVIMLLFATRHVVIGRNRLRGLALGVIVFALAQFVPDITITVMLTLVAVAVIWAAVLRIPKRVFADPDHS